MSKPDTFLIDQCDFIFGYGCKCEKRLIGPNVPLAYALAHAARRYNRQPGERSQAWRRAVDNTSLRRRDGGQQTRIRASARTWAVVSDVAVAHVRHARPGRGLTSPTCISVF